MSHYHQPKKEDDIIWPEYLYTFLKIIKSSPLDKNVLDCGAGGHRPPLALFKLKGYETCGVDISDKALQLASNFAELNHLNLNIQKGDMRNLPFDDESILTPSTKKIKVFAQIQIDK